MYEQNGDMEVLSEDARNFGSRDSDVIILSICCVGQLTPLPLRITTQARSMMFFAQIRIFSQPTKFNIMNLS